MKPEKVIRIGSVSVSVFVNEVESDGGKRVIRSANLQRRFRDDDGTWKSSTSFRLAELPQAISVLKLAMESIAAEEAEVTPG